MNKLMHVTAVAGLLSAAAFAQAEGISGNVTLTSDYVWRGISQTQNNGAIQGGFDYEHESGFYLGVWGSNVNYDFDSDANIELDYYGGYSTTINEDITVDVGLLKYAYPSASGINFTEGYINISAMGFTLGFNSSGSLFADESTDYTSLGYEIEVAGEVTLNAAYGRYDLKSDVYEDYKLSASKSFFGVDWALTYTDTDLSSSECESSVGDEDYCDAIVAISMSKSL